MEFEIQGCSISRTNRAKAAIQLLVNGQPMDVQNVDLTKADKREAVIEAWVEQFPGLTSQADAIRQEFIEMAFRLLSADDNTDNNSDDEGEVTPLALSKQAIKKTSVKLIAIAEKFLRCHDLLDRICQHICLCGLEGEQDLAAQTYLLGTSRLLSKPLAGITLGCSAGGKSYAGNVVGSLFPDETILKANQLSPKALVYMLPGSLEHRFLLLGERSRNTDDDYAEQTRMWRELVADGRCSIAVTTKGDDGRFTTEHRIQEGPVACLESSTLGVDSIFTEDKTRLLLFGVDESKAQTGRIVSRMARDAQQPSDPEEIESIQQLHFTMQRLLDARDVEVPFAEQLTSALPLDRIELRRTFGHLLSAIKSVALLHQKQRQLSNDGLIIAVEQDYEIARRVFWEPLGRSVGQILTGGAKAMLDHIKKLYDCDATWTASNLAERSGVSKSTVYDRLKELRRSGDVVIDEIGEGKIASRHRLALYPEPSDFSLPSLSPESRTQAPVAEANTYA